jgi:hypothetical protein
MKKFSGCLLLVVAASTASLPLIFAAGASGLYLVTRD